MAHFDHDSLTYFAAKEPEQTASVLMEKADSFYNNLSSNAYMDKLERMWRFYHGAYSEGYGDGPHSISFTGEQGELVSVPVNHFRNLAQHIFVMITATRPVMEARAVNTDYKSLAQTQLANGILDYYMREKNLEDAIKKATELSIVLGSAYVKMEWNANTGREVDADVNEEGDEAEIFYEGEVEFTTASPFDVVVDGTKENWDHEWIMLRSFKNRFDLAAKYPEKEEEILGMPSKDEMSSYRYTIMSNDKTDDIPIYEFYHKKTPSIPEGRYMLFAGPDAILADSELPYREIPVYRIAPNDILGTPYGYSPMFDIYPIQEGINSLYSTIMTNQNAFGVQNLFVQRGSDLSVSQLEGGLNLVEGNQKPEPLSLAETPEEVFKFLEILIQSAETISGVNSVARGNPQASLESGSALALVQSMSLQFISGLQQSYVKLIEDCGTALINILKDYAHSPKLIALVGKHNQSYLKEFTGDQISDINRVIVDMGNPLSRTIAGRVQMAGDLLQMQAIKNPEQYFQVMNTGRLDSLYEGEMSELLSIKQENEKLIEGINPLVAPTDRHRMHILEHKSVLSNPDLRSNPELVKIAMDHIQGHLQALRETDPDLLQLVGEQPLNPIGSGQLPAEGLPTDGMSPQATGGADVLAAPPSDIAPLDQEPGPGQQSVKNPGGPNLPTPPAPFENNPSGYVPPSGN